MMEISAKSTRSFGERCYALNVAAHAVRQRATRDGRDIEGWRLSRRMREAETDTQVNVAERQYNVWLQTIPLQERVVCRQ
jgi:hypothetical protein